MEERVLKGDLAYESSPPKLPGCLLAKTWWLNFKLWARQEPRPSVSMVRGYSFSRLPHWASKTGGRRSYSSRRTDNCFRHHLWEKRVPWIAQPEVHKLLLETWEEAQAWLIGNYLLMPDHLHLFCAPHNLEIPLNRWMSYWKRLFTQKAERPDWQWQPHHWDTRLRRSENSPKSGITSVRTR